MGPCIGEGNRTHPGAASRTRRRLEAEGMTRFESISLKKVKPNRLNPRSEFRKEALDQLSDSVQLFGLLQPIVVRPSNATFEVVVGERRYRAALQAGVDGSSARICEDSGGEGGEVKLVGERHKQRLNSIEEEKT